MNSNRSDRPHFIRSSHPLRQKQKQKQKPDQIRKRMLCLLLRRIGYGKMRNCFQLVWKYGDNFYGVLDRAVRRVSRNVEFCRVVAWRRLVDWGRVKRRDLHLVRFVGLVGEKVRNHVKALAFRSISKYNQIKPTTAIKLLQSSKPSLLKSTLQKPLTRILSQTLLHLLLHSQKSKKSQQAYKYLSKTIYVLTLRRVQNGWSKMMGLSNSEHNDIQHELGELNKEMNFMRKELARKNKEIVQLEMEISVRNQESRYYQYYGQVGGRNGTSSNRKLDQSLENSRRSMKSIGSRRNSSEEKDKGDLGSIDNINTSALSWLNGSFMSIKSGKSSMSRSITGMECYCKYREKYTQYKAETSSLKNQLQIIKSQLQVTKDLNEHLQQQISNLCLTNTTMDKESNIQLQALKAEIKELKKQKQIMKEKLLHNQKYIVNLKCQFKGKIQGLYRNLRKNN